MEIGNMNMGGDTTTLSGVLDNVPIESDQLMPHVLAIRNFAAEFAVESIIDYGCGSADLYQEGVYVSHCEHIKDYWDVQDIRLYDPNHTKYSTYPTGSADMVICTDFLCQLSHDEQVKALVQINNLSTKCVYISVGVTPKGCQWWCDFIAKHMTKPFLLFVG